MNSNQGRKEQETFCFCVTRIMYPMSHFPPLFFSYNVILAFFFANWYQLICTQEIRRGVRLSLEELFFLFFTRTGRALKTLLERVMTHDNNVYTLRHLAGSTGNLEQHIYVFLFHELISFHNEQLTIIQCCNDSSATQCLSNLITQEKWKQRARIKKRGY